MPPPGVCLNIMEARHKKSGIGSSSRPESLFNQDYEQLKRFCLTRKVKYIDELFPPVTWSIGMGLLRPDDLSKVQWLRPWDISSNPSVVLDGISRFDFEQGLVGNCWFLASIGALTFQSQVLMQVMPPGQTFHEDYCGLFHFRFWRFGMWVDVVIDDKLPTINGRLIFVHSKDPNEFWPALLEKAYAKVCGSYADMRAGTPAEAMMDFTGGVLMHIDLSDPPANMWDLMFRAGQTTSLMSCGTHPGETSDNTVLRNGLVQGHAYTVTGLKQLTSGGKLVHLVRLWNPWGKGEWNGDWSDKSSLWLTVNAQDRHMCHSVRDDGEFWMTLQEVCQFYSDLSICCLTPNFLDGNSSCHWTASVLEGRWVSGITAGGCPQNKESFWTNPQYRVRIDGQHSERDGEKNTLLSLMQKPDKQNRHLVQNLHIGLSVFEVPEQYRTHRGKFPATFFSTHTPAAQTKTYLNARQVMESLALKPGDYLIVPSTYRPNETSSFILTIHSKTDAHGYENSNDYKNEPLQKSPLEEQRENPQDDKKKTTLFHEHSDKYEEVDAEQLQKLLNENILKGELKSGGFSVNDCRSMVALMDKSITGKLNREEFVYLWNKVVKYKNIFFLTDVSRTGTLSLSELRNAFEASGKRLSDAMLNLMALRYGTSSGHITLESFITLILRLDCMYKIFNKLSDGKAMSLQESEWIYISMYT
ncbi:calpain-1 catalytic subunit-like [Solea solea]|uniref:calpain-1 catalytic subunit-like n=1 Tax=Solea solea TaxID=90069 RepID=UPI00272CEF4C|nr:calpain-1 catalytic subunit-like [Solea solea]XP_058472245.1 calpain-1 catalytic subunit-like [Solea solea]XP_058472246.1 calpain-1 catalytic subunit-like [Solea solea]